MSSGASNARFRRPNAVPTSWAIDRLVASNEGPIVDPLAHEGPGPSGARLFTLCPSRDLASSARKFGTSGNVG